MSTMHLQDQILASMQATLLAANTSAGDRVYVEGVDAIPANATPALAIEVGPEAIETRTLASPRTQQRTFDVLVRVIVASDNTGYRAAAGRLLLELEQALCGSPEAQTAGGISPGGMHLVATDPDRDGNAARITYTIRTLWRMAYVCKENAPHTARA